MNEIWQISYINIQWWMIYDLDLSWNELLLYALIYWYTQDWKNEYHWTLNYIANWLKISRRSAINLLQKLQEKWYIIKTKESYFKTSEKVALVKKLHSTSEKVAPLTSEKVAPNNNKEIIINNNNNKLSKDNLEQSSELVKTDKRNPDINHIQEIIKITVSELWLLYKPWKKERERIQNILTSKDYWNICEKTNMTREEFLINIIQLSTKLDFWHWKIYNAETFYKYYADIYNNAVRIKAEKNNNKKISDIVF